MSIATPTSMALGIICYAVVFVIPLWLLVLLVRNIIDVFSLPRENDETRIPRRKLRLLLAWRLGIVAALVGIVYTLYQVSVEIPMLIPLDIDLKPTEYMHHVAVFITCICNSLGVLCITFVILCFGVFQYYFFDHYWKNKEIQKQKAINQPQPKAIK